MHPSPPARAHLPLLAHTPSRARTRALSRSLIYFESCTSHLYHTYPRHVPDATCVCRAGTTRLARFRKMGCTLTRTRTRPGQTTSTNSSQRSPRTALTRTSRSPSRAPGKQNHRPHRQMHQTPTPTRQPAALAVHAGCRQSRPSTQGHPRPPTATHVPSRLRATIQCYHRGTDLSALVVDWYSSCFLCVFFWQVPELRRGARRPEARLHGRMSAEPCMLLDQCHLPCTREHGVDGHLLLGNPAVLPERVNGGAGRRLPGWDARECVGAVGGCGGGTSISRQGGVW